VEFRASIHIPDLDIESDAAGDLLTALERLHGDLGPVLDGGGKSLHVVLATDRPTVADAAAEMFAATVDGLSACGLGDRCPDRVAIEPVTVEAAATL
jgi:hypothetical protein